MTGGSFEGDTFVYTGIADSAAGAERDLINDFEIAYDIIDLSAIDAKSSDAADDAFQFIGSSDFTGVAGELRFGDDTSGNWLLEGDVDGDGSADFQIEFLANAQMFTANLVL
jgi:serralysin